MARKNQQSTHRYHSRTCISQMALRSSAPASSRSRSGIGRGSNNFSEFTDYNGNSTGAFWKRNTEADTATFYRKSPQAFAAASAHSARRIAATPAITPVDSFSPYRLLFLLSSNFEHKKYFKRREGCLNLPSLHFTPICHANYYFKYIITSTESARLYCKDNTHCSKSLTQN